MTKLAKVRRGSSGEPPSASWLADTGALAVARSSGSERLPAPSAFRASRDAVESWAGAAQRGAHGEIDPVHFRHFGLPAGKNPLGVMRLDPALEKARRDRKVDAFVLNALQIHAGKPTRVHVLADARPQPAFHARPTILIHVRHCVRHCVCHCVCHCLGTSLKVLKSEAAALAAWEPPRLKPVSAIGRPFGETPSGSWSAEKEVSGG